MKTRIDQFGVASPTITLQANTGRIILELPGLDDPSRVRKILQQTAQLEFWDTYETKKLLMHLAQGDIALGTKIFNENKANGVDSTTAAADTTGCTALNDLTANADTAKKNLPIQLNLQLMRTYRRKRLFELTTSILNIWNLARP